MSSKCSSRTFSAENVDYECVERINRFLVLHGGVWHALTFSDTAPMIKAVDELQEEISRAIRNCECSGSEPLQDSNPLLREKLEGMTQVRKLSFDPGPSRRVESATCRLVEI